MDALTPFLLLLSVGAAIILVLAWNRSLRKMVQLRVRDLRASEQRLRFALGAARMIAWRWDVAGDTLAWGEPPDWFIGPAPPGGYPDFRELVHPEDRPAFLQAGRRSIAQGTQYRAEFRIVRTDGAVRWLEARGMPSADPEAGRIRYLDGVSQDITERKEAEARIARLDKLYAALSQCNQAIVRSNGEDDLFPQICRDAVQFGGMKMAWIRMVDAASLKVKPVAAFGEGLESLPEIEISVDPGSAFGQGMIGTAIRENRPVWCQDYLNDPMTAPWHELGARFGWAAAATLPLHRGGVAIGAFTVVSGVAGVFDEDTRNLLVGMALDISFALDNFEHESRRRKADEALRASEEKFAKAFRSSPTFISISTVAEGRYIEVNEGFLRGTGHARAEVIGRTSADIALWNRPEDRRRAIAALRKDGRVSGFEAELRKKSGATMICEIWAEPITIEDAPCVVWVTNDISERKKDEAEIRQLNAELEQRVAERTQALEASNNELEAFSYSVSHDLRAPLRAIQGFSSLVEQQYAGQIDEQGRDMLRRVGAGAQKMGQLIDDLLNLSRISRQAMQIERVDLSALANELAVELQAETPQRKVAWAIAPGITAEGDPGLLRVALQNLLGNAWKYSSRRGDARIEFGVTEKDGRPVYFVRDNGAGFDMAYAGKLFGAFQRLHSAAEFPGSGIGLATVARILRRHGGRTWAEGRVGEGATFNFSLGPNPAQPDAPRPNQA